MARKPPFKLANLTDTTTIAILQGDNQAAFPFPYGDLKSAIISESIKVGSVTFGSNTYSVTFSSNFSSANYQVAFMGLPDDVNPADPDTKTVSGFSGTYIGEGSGSGGFIAAVENN